MTIADYLSTAPAAAPWPGVVTGRGTVVLGGRSAREAAARGILRRIAESHPHLALTVTPPARSWPFDRNLGLAADVSDGVLWATDLHEAFENAQTNATRLVTTQAAFLWQAWSDRLRGRDIVVVATGDRTVFEAHAPDALAGRGPWRDVQWIDVDAAPQAAPADAPPATAPTDLPSAFRAADPASRLTAAGRALDADRSAGRLLAMASVCMEVNDLDSAGALLDEVARGEGDWAAAAFEHGKYWLRRDDMPAAAAAFARAARLMPGFASAAANLGATLGELDRPDDALAAFRQALAADPDNPQVHNNLGVVLRETGRLADAESAFRRAIALTPGMAFGHYNLGHTLFLQGRYQASLAAYQAGQRLDAGRSPVQASRLALARLATGDARGALRDLQGCTANLPGGYRRQVLADTQSVAWALLSTTPDLPDWRMVGDWLAAELAKA